jgi:hypothetical protein
MKATVVQWDDAKLEKGTKVLVQGALMNFLKDVPDKSDEDVRVIELEYKGMNMETGVFRHYYTAVIDGDTEAESDGASE